MFFLLPILTEIAIAAGIGGATGYTIAKITD